MGEVPYEGLHSRIRRHSLDVKSSLVKANGAVRNDLLDRLKSDPAFANVNLSQVMNARQFVGRAPQQVDAFVEGVVSPIRERYRDQLGQRADLKV